MHHSFDAPPTDVPDVPRCLYPKPNAAGLGRGRQGRPLRDDIRLLGRILGDTVREQEGEEVFELVEQIRRASIRFHRDNEVAARRELEATLDSLSAEQTLAIVRAYSYFSHLANIAEDQHHIRRNRAHAIAGSAPRPGSLAYAFQRTREMGVEPKALSDFFDRALVSPVLTAHPTEVRRKSTLTRELEIAELLDERERIVEPVELAANEERLRRAVLILWRTNLLRQTKLKVIDEVANALSFYDYTFFRELPRLYGAIEDKLDAISAEPRAAPIGSFLRIGSWIGGDRDGNPFVTADVLNEAMRLQSGRAIGHYLDELHELGAELSLAANLASMSPELAELADTSDDSAAARRKEPYRRAIAGMYSRLARTARELDHVIAPRQPIVDRAPYASAAEFSADLAVIARSLERTNAGIVARGRLRSLQRAVDVFGFHLAPLDLRQNSDVHERTIAELFSAASPGFDYKALSEAERVELLRRELVSPRPLLSPFIAYSEETAGELALFRAAADIRSKYGPRRDPNLHHLQDRQRLGHAGAGADDEGDRPHSRRVGLAPSRAAVRDDHGLARLRRRDGFAAGDPRIPAARQFARRRAGGDARLFRLQQGRRVRHLGLGIVQGRDRPGRGVPPSWRAHPPLPWARRLGRARRRPELRRDPRPAGRRGAGADPHHRAGRDHSSKYSNPDVGRRNLETLASATLEATLLQDESPAPDPAFLETMEELSSSAYNAYRGLVYGTEGFERYFWSSTVITEIASLNIGSRPASRKKTTAIEDLRAIPWVFSWAQCRLMLPGWFGFGSAVKAYIAAHPKDGLDKLKAMHGRWPFFRTLLSNMDMVLSKSSLAIASRYARLVGDVALREKIFARISQEWRELGRRAQRDHGAVEAAREQSAARPLDPQPLPLSRSAQPRAGRAFETASLARGEREGADRNPAHHQRHIGGAAQQRVESDEQSWPLASEA